ncbi:FecR family protein [Pedobacter gandavensis]|uniref:FecR family protein n=1 Tax=Pedobacter gandavensis TaxID=2679963 RepID=UPI00292E107E|nr:FecR family protein [Pedobacter gandavensis]
MKRYSPEELIQNYVNGDASEEECIIVESWHIQDIKESNNIPSKETITIVQKRMWSNLTSHIHHRKDLVGIKELWVKIGITAAAVLITAGTIYLYTQTFSNPSTLVLYQNDVAPGQNKATLTLNNGKEIFLNNNTKELIAIQGGTNVSRSNGLLIYAPSRTHTTLVVNKLETPRGGKYQLLLADGTKVWLNSSSILTYPSNFKGNERKVTLEGEAYFEVAKDINKVFKVICKEQTIEVLGTHFNIKSYQDDDETRTALAEGKVKITKGLTHTILKPGQVAQTNKNSKNIKIENTDIEKNFAWKNNEFIFIGDDLISIMKEVSRWYDVEVIYKGSFKQGKYWGVVSRSKNISEVLKMLQLTGKINFKIEGRRITLMN